MKKIAIVYHSGYGHTEFFAQQIAASVSANKKVSVTLLKTDDVSKNPDQLKDYDAFIFGSPTYMGNVSGPFKTFMDATGGLWQKGDLKNKYAAGFTVSGSPSGDKLNTLVSLSIFAAQHGMIWIGNHIIPETYAGVAPDQAANRLGSFLGVMAQAGNEAPDKSFVPGDLKTAKMFGERVAQIVGG
ncbi:MAG: flavodoxin family protein [Pseudobdellovibrionaceae bacterium]